MLSLLSHFTIEEFLQIEKTWQVPMQVPIINEDMGYSNDLNGDDQTLFTVLKAE